MQQETGRPGMSSHAEQLAPSRYRIVKMLGRGGMGEVYLAQDLEGTGDLLRDPAGNTFITKIEVGSLVCNFESKDQGLRVVIMDP